DEKELALERDDVDRRDDVGVLHASRHARLVEEHRRELGILRDVRMQLLDRYGAREARRTDESSEVNGGHAARSDLVVKDVLAEDAAAARDAALRGVVDAPRFSHAER